MTYVNLVRKLNKIQLNLGIKNFIKSLLCSIDNLVIQPIFKTVYSYLYNRIVFHYGASYNYAKGNNVSQNLNLDTLNFGYGSIHYALIRNKLPKRILCIGSMYGYIPFICALAAKNNQFGKVDFVDASYDVNNPKDKQKHSFGQGHWKKIVPKKHFSYLGVQNQINIHIMTTKEFSKKYPTRKYDYIYIDGDHRYKGVSLDFSLFWKRLNKDGLMVFHDIAKNGLFGDVNFQVGKFWQEVKKNNKSWIDFTENGADGLGILQK